MEISKLLWSPHESSSSPHPSRQPSGEPQVCRPAASCETSCLRTAATPAAFGLKSSGYTTTKTSSALSATATYTMVPDKDRKRCYHLSATQKREKEAFDSRVLNLTLDINQLRQDVDDLNNCRDLQITRLLLDRQTLESNILKVADKLLFGKERIPGPMQSARGGSCSFSGVLTGQSTIVPSKGVVEFRLLLDRPNPHHRSDVFATTQVLSILGGDAGVDSEEDAKIRQICGDPGGCVVEAVGSLTGRLSREVIVSLIPHAIDNEVLTSGLVGLVVTFPARLLLYFDAQHQLIRQVAQTGVANALEAVRQARPVEFAAAMGYLGVSMVQTDTYRLQKRRI